MNITKHQREKILRKSDGLCWYCGKYLSGKWHIDHVEPVYRSTGKTAKNPQFGPVPDNVKKLLNDSGMRKPENDKLENMVPACIPCNLFKSVHSIENFRQEIGKQVIRARESNINFRTAERFGLIKQTGNPVQFWFERTALETQE